jgi:hypothetical protein
VLAAVSGSQKGLRIPFATIRVRSRIHHLGQELETATGGHHRRRVGFARGRSVVDAADRRCLSSLEAKEQMRTAGLIVLVAIVVLGVWTLGSNSGSISVCTKTGMLRYSSTRGPFGNVRIEETPLSRVLVETGCRRPDEHVWQFAHGRGRELLNGPYTASGATLMPGTVQSPEVASAVRLLISYTDKPTVERWLGRIFDPSISPQVPLYIGSLAGVTNRLDFLRELANSEALFQEMEIAKRK